ncbi:S-adenosyl-L-methionine-dependent methyltransferases superfamily protein [Rhynchospora pubera]|uniref:S-adenosyl-L-methionine-dependent methyltransferases superfamily protein n=1 Tax=Rhynchospora pubera TaxID=906938 RepID=A0AAV8DXZ1_9POAL|nr:S-adenosyl-L-methionine-dependent methyltransferases superfamily protein [Rhynchospora pubera]
MADLFNKQAEKYAEARPTYPAELFDFIASKTPRHDLVWDVGTGNGQAAVQLAEIYKNVVATDVSRQQLNLARKLPNIRYVHTPGSRSLYELHIDVAPPDSVDLVTAAQALHWFGLPLFYEQVRSVLRKPDGIIAAWSYLEPTVDPAVDAVFSSLYNWSKPYWAPQRKIVDDRYQDLEFPFEPVQGEPSTGPFDFFTEKKMNLSLFLKYIRSWSAYQTAKEKGVEMLPDETVADFRKVWGSDGEEVKTVRFPIFLMIGKVGVNLVDAGN